MEQTLKARFSLVSVIINIILACLVLACISWVSQEWAENSTPLPETKIIKPWTPNGYEALTLTNGKNVNWQSSTPPIITTTRNLFLQKNISGVIVHYLQYSNSTGVVLIYYGKTEDGNLVLYKEILSSAGFTQGSNYNWQVNVNVQEGVVEFLAKGHVSYLLLLSSIVMFFLSLVTILRFT